MIAKLKVRVPSVQDESSSAALAQYAKGRACMLPTARMVQAFDAALAQPACSPPMAAMRGTCWTTTSLACT